MVILLFCAMRFVLLLLLTASSAEAASLQSIFRKSFLQEHTAGLVPFEKPVQSRALAGACTFDKAVEAKCTLKDWCKEVEDAFEDVKCKGDTKNDWKLVQTREEQCFYAQADESDFNNTLFDPDTDFCVKSEVVYNLSGVRPRSGTDTFQVTRPMVATRVYSHKLKPCRDKQTSNDFLFGFCSECDGFSLDGRSCSSCSTCNNGNVAADCSNVFPLVTTCSRDENEDAEKKFLEYSGAVCSMEALQAQRCSLDRYCAQLSFDVTCEGDSSDHWTMSWTDKEECYLDDGTAGVSIASAEYCSQASTVLTFKADSLLSETYAYRITHPTTGLLTWSQDYAICNETDYFTFGGSSFCPDGCPVTFLEGQQCAGCVDECNALDCSNIDSSLVESCAGTDWTPALVAYLTPEPTAAPVTETPATSMPVTISPTSGTTESPVLSPTDSNTTSVEASTSRAAELFLGHMILGLLF